MISYSYMKTADDGARFVLLVDDISTPCDVGSKLDGWIDDRVAWVAGGFELSAAAMTTV